MRDATLCENPWLAVVLIAGLLSACAPDAGSDATAEPSVPGRWYTASQLESGRATFQTHCAGCHGLQAQGTADWKQRDAAGNLPPPPLNGSAHAWHHPLAQLTDYVLAGGVPLGGTMPGFAGVLDQPQATAAVAYFQSFWDQDIYARWISMYPVQTGSESAAL
jgi:mono/diheme cytochrome c family protein